MTSGLLYLLNIGIYAFFPFFLSKRRSNHNLVSFYVYMGVVLTVGGFLGALYSFSFKSAGVLLSGGSLAYGAFMMSAVMLFILEKNLSALRDSIRLVLIVNMFKIGIFKIIAIALDHPSMQNALGVPSSVFKLSLYVVLLGGLLILLELFVLVLMLEWLKSRIRKPFLFTAMTIPLYLGILLLDGALFPLLAKGLAPGIGGALLTGLKSKTILALSYIPPLAAFLLLNKNSISSFMDAPLNLKQLFLVPKGDLLAEIQRQRKTLEREEQKFRHLAESINDIFFSVDKSLAITYWNKASEQLGIRSEQALGKSLWELFPLALKEPMHSFILRVQHEGKATRFVQSYGEGESATYFEISAYPFGEGISVIARDISEHMKADATLKASLAEKEVLLQELYHRTKNNMQVISSMLSLQASDITDEAALEAFKETENRIQAMALVHQKLYRSKDLSSINLREYIGDLSSMLGESYSSRLGPIEFALDLEDVFVHLDVAVPTGLILNELVTNSLKHAFPDNRPGTVTIRLRAGDGGGFDLLVADDGVGLPADFEFSKNSRLGLETVTGIVEHQLGGTLSIEPGAGAAFLVSIKARDAQRDLPQ